MFTTEFDKYACVGDAIECTVDGFTVTARIEHDYEATPMDYDQPGWCYDTSDPTYGEENQRIIDSWKGGEWTYCGIVLSVSRNGVCLDRNAASLWGIEMNFPESDNAYLRTVANELLDEAVSVGRDTLSRLCAA